MRSNHTNNRHSAENKIQNYSRGVEVSVRKRNVVQRPLRRDESSKHTHCTLALCGCGYATQLQKGCWSGPYPQQPKGVLTQASLSNKYIKEQIWHQQYLRCSPSSQKPFPPSLQHYFLENTFSQTSSADKLTYFVRPKAFKFQTCFLSFNFRKIFHYTKCGIIKKSPIPLAGTCTTFLCILFSFY